MKALHCLGLKMSKIISFFIILIFLAAFCIIINQPAKATADSWVTKTPMPSANAGGVAVAFDGEIYVIGSGFNYVYNPSTNTWISKTPLPTNQQSFAVAADKNKIYVSGGCSGFDQKTGYPINCTGVNEVYNPNADTWETKTSMPTARAEMQAITVNDKIYVISGTLSDGSVSNVTEVYDPSSDSWSSAAPIPTPVGLYASTVVNNKIYVEGGGKSGPVITDLNQIYNPLTNAWTLGAPLPAPVLLATAGATTGVWAPIRLYVIGGTTDGINILNTTRIYDPQTDRWTTGASIPPARGTLSVAVVNDTLYTLGGTNNLLNPKAPTTAVNEQYFPLGYSETGQSPSNQTAIIYTAIAATVLIIILMVIAVVIFLKRAHNSVSSSIKV